MGEFSRRKRPSIRQTDNGESKKNVSPKGGTTGPYQCGSSGEKLLLCTKLIRLNFVRCARQTLSEDIAHD